MQVLKVFLRFIFNISYLLYSWESDINLLIYLLRGTVIHTLPSRCDRYGSTSSIKKKKERLNHSSNGKHEVNTRKKQQETACDERLKSVFRAFVM